MSRKELTMTEERNNNQVVRQIGRIISGGYIDHQQVRISTMNRIRDVVRHVNEGIPFGETEEPKEERDFDKKYKDDNLPGLIEEMFEGGRVTREERDYLRRALELGHRASSLEQSHKGPMRTYASREPVWIGFLQHVPGIGDVLSARLIAKFGNCEQYERVSSLWRHCGFHTVCPKCTEKKDGKVFSVVATIKGLCPRCGLRGISPKRKRGVKCDFDMSRKTLAWNVAGCLLKQRSPIYYEIYSAEKARQLAREYPKGVLLELYRNRDKKEGKEKEKEKEGKEVYKQEDVHIKLGHAHNRALRKMVKIFLQHYWAAARELSGLPTTEPYVQEKMGHPHIITWTDVLRANNVNVEE